jgi:alpha-tubulin suppressor-like RCC1 family protein
MGRLNRPSLILNPAGVATPDTAYVEVETVIRQTCVLTDMGEIRCGGDGNGNNGDNRLGTGTDDKSYRQCCVSRPDPAPPLFSAIGAESGYTCGISRDDGSIWCAGSNPASATGSDVYEQRTPDGGYEDLRLGRNYFCGIRDNILDCFTGTNPLPDDAPIDITGHRSLSTGNQAMCLVTATGELRCYGADPWKEDYPVNPALLGTGWQSVAIPQHGLEVDRNGHRCGIREDGTLRCWGENGETDPNANGRVGVDSALMSRVPEDMPVQVGVETDWTSVAVGYQHTCGIRGDRELYCWGRNQSGQLGRSGSGFEAGHVCLPRW